MRKWFVSVLSVMLVATLLAACGGAAAPSGGAAESTGGDTGAAAGSADSGEKITLRVWSHQNTAFIQANEQIIAVSSLFDSVALSRTREARKKFWRSCCSGVVPPQESTTSENTTTRG